MKNMTKDAAILFAITLIAGFVLGFVYNVTKEPIAQAEEKAQRKPMQRSFRMRRILMSLRSKKTVHT